MDHPLDGARERIKRADKHLNDFISEVEAYAASEAMQRHRIDFCRCYTVKPTIS